MTVSEIDELRRRNHALEAEAAHLRTQMEEGSTSDRQLLAASEHRQQAILNSTTGFAIIVTDTDGCVTDWNTGAERILGWSAEEMQGQTATRFFTPEDRATGQVDAEMQGALERGRAADERWHLREDGTRFWASGEMMPLRHADGVHIGFVKILRDRTAEHQAGVALRETETRLRRAQEVGGVGMFSVGIEDGIVHPTPEFCRLYGLPERDSYPAEEFERLIVPEDARLISTVASRRSGDVPRDVEYRIHRFDDGKLRWIARRGEIERDDAGRPLRFVGVAQDITDRKQIERRVDASEQQMRLVADALPVLIAFIDASLTYRFANLAYRDWFDVDGPEDVVGRSVRDLFSADDFEARRSAFEQALAGIEVRFDLPWPRRDGLARLADIRYLPRRRRNGTVDGFYVFVQDVTDRQRAEEMLRSLNETLAQQVEERTRERDRLWHISQDLLVIIDTKGVFRSVSPSSTTMLGWTPEEMLGRTVFDFTIPDDQVPTGAALAHASQQQLPIFENRYRHKDGSYRWMSWVATPADDVIYATGRNITAEKERQAELATAQDALRQSQKMEAVGQLTGGLAHDFNNLLAGISGSLELMQTRMSQGRLNDLERYMAAAQGASKRAAALTHRLLAFSRRQTLDPKPTDVNRLVADMEELIRRTIGPEVSLEVVGTSGLWSTLVDPSQLENALLNLCINARDAMPDGGRITIETANKWMDHHGSKERDLDPGQYLSLCVTDTGTGMTPDVIAKAFEPFFTTKPIGQGTGLGLSMIYGFVRQSGGQVRIYSEVGNGTTMCLYLPRHYGAAEGGDAMPDLSEVPGADQGQTVLVVDDEPTVRMLVTEVLEDLGYTAIEAADGPAGLKVLQSNVRIDLLVTDVGLPGGMNGRQVADAARVGRPELKVLFITGYAENAAVGNGHLDPGMQVLTKPFAMEALASRIREMIAA